MRSILSIFGTRPDAIKMAPVVRAIQASSRLESLVCVTGQHRGMLDQVLGIFDLVPDFDLSVMRENQDLFDVTTGILTKLKPVLEAAKPDCVLVHGDSSTAFASALTAFYLKIPIGHVEAGLRTGRIYSPFPEEANRQLVGGVSTFHFAPTKRSAENLRNEGFPEATIFTTGNTVVDALLWVNERTKSVPRLEALFGKKPMVLMTVHRRESFGKGVRSIFRAVETFAREFPGFHVVYPVHPNPNVRHVATEMLGALPNVSLIDPVDYRELAFLVKRCHFLLTDSGGLQEEAPTFGKPLLVLRDTTERPEAVDAGCAMLVGTDEETILGAMRLLAREGSALYEKMSRVANPFGDGYAAERIARALETADFAALPPRYQPPGGVP